MTLRHLILCRRKYKYIIPWRKIITQYTNVCTKVVARSLAESQKWIIIWPIMSRKNHSNVNIAQNSLHIKAIWDTIWKRSIQKKSNTTKLWLENMKIPKCLKSTKKKQMKEKHKRKNLENENWKLKTITKESCL